LLTPITVNSFAATLMAFPLQADIIADAVYGYSKTMDGRHFAAEFIRRKKAAEKGIVEKQPANSPSADTQASSSGGWNEVAKKSTHKEPTSESGSIQAAGFKVVPSRKKGKK
jgi:PERQ amino acid-rich with GYF domain-containing protein